MRSLFKKTLYACVALAAFANAAVDFDHFIVKNATDIHPYGGSLRHIFEFNIKDPNTETQTQCELDLSKDYIQVVPSTWNQCKDATFTWKFDAYGYGEPMVIELKHQYTGKGKLCAKSNGPNCTTSRGYFSLDPESFHSSHSANGLHNYWDGPYNATIFSTCSAGCQLTSGAN